MKMAASVAMQPSNWVPLLVFLLSLPVMLARTLYGDGKEFDFDGPKGVTYDFKMEIGPGKEECFYQFAKTGAQLHVSFEVLRGADRNIDMVIRKPSGDIMESHLWTKEGYTDTQVSDEGIYAFCFDNSFSRFSHKLVYFFMVVYVTEEWQKQMDEQKDQLDKFNMSITSFSESLEVIHKSVNNMTISQAMNRQKVVKDWYLIKGNYDNIQFYSVLMCCVVVVTSGFQVFFVRSLFSSKNVTPGEKPRA